MAKEEIKPLRILCEEPVLTIFTDGFQGMGVTGGTVRLNLVEDKMNPATGEIVRHVVARTIMPLEVLDSYIQLLSELRDQVKTTVAGMKDGPK